ncbi:hypothetical protein TIFTF001_032826 [Ficus carica]|uniref:Uncharacterized protein n=1 Tax=Ficus carica TaxID=3494 RepID=A0AA88DXD4_FICCA|nr:hypothetical protein TIFTF001_032826 [Ficus carica]
MIRANSSSVKMEWGFTIHKKDSVLFQCGGLLNRAIGGMERAPVPRHHYLSIPLKRLIARLGAFSVLEAFVPLPRTSKDGCQFIFFGVVVLHIDVCWDIDVLI